MGEFGAADKSWPVNHASQYLADISKESKMREHLTKKGPLTLALIG